jgi:predicted nucleotidyltransferase
MDQLHEIKNELRKMKPELVERFHVNSIGLFGSVVRDDFNEKSDIDIIVDFTRPIGIAFIDLADLLEAALKRPVDLVSKKGVKDKYFKVIQPEIEYV